MSASIEFADLWIYDARLGQGRHPLSALRDGAHVHGNLTIGIGGRAFPGLGYWGPSDVCLGMWAAELQSVANAVRTSADARYLFDEGEQGQPAYEFVGEATRSSCR